AQPAAGQPDEPAGDDDEHLQDEDGDEDPAQPGGVHGHLLMVGRHRREPSAPRAGPRPAPSATLRQGQSDQRRRREARSPVTAAHTASTMMSPVGKAPSTRAARSPSPSADEGRRLTIVLHGSGKRSAGMRTPPAAAS